MTPRGRYQGALQILLYNWPFYLATVVLSALGLAARSIAGVPDLARAGLAAAAGAALFWAASSLAVSHWVYDRSGLTRWDWIAPWFPEPPRAWANLHAGLDESTLALRALFPGTSSVVLDIFDPAVMKEPSIARARRLTPAPVPARPVSLGDLPFPAGAWDAAFVLFAAHEIRRGELRARFFAELGRVVRPGGLVLLVEHLRDLPNLLAFGPGFLHFLGRGEWGKAAAAGGFRVARESARTPFVRALLLERQR